MGVYDNIKLFDPAWVPVQWSLTALGLATLEPLLVGLPEPSEYQWNDLRDWLDDRDRPLSLTKSGPRALKFHELMCLRQFFWGVSRDWDRDWWEEILELLPPTDSFCSYRRNISPAFSRSDG